MTANPSERNGRKLGHWHQDERLHQSLPGGTKWADLLREKLAEQGIDVWDSKEEMPPGANWALVYGKALEDSDAMIVLLSPDSAKSDWVRHEIDYALMAPRFRNRLISLVVRPTREIPWILEKQPHFIRAQKHVDATVRDVAGALKTKSARRRRTRPYFSAFARR